MTLGRLASEVAKVLRGKNKPIFTPHIDTGDYVIVVNAEKVKVTGKKLDARRPNVIPSASTTYHFLSMVAGLAIKVFIVIPPRKMLFISGSVNVRHTVLHVILFIVKWHSGALE